MSTAANKIRSLLGIGAEGDPNAPAPDPHAQPGVPVPDPNKPAEPKPADPNPGPTDPLAAFAAIFDNTKPAVPGQEDIPASVANILTAENVKGITDKLNFLDYITPETREAIAAGGDNGKALMTAFNEIGIGAYQNALAHGTKVSESIMEDRLSRMEATFSDKIKASQVQSNISAHESISKSPVLQAGISMIADRLRQTNPTASAEDITKQATDFFMESAKVLGGGESGDNLGGGGNPAPTGQETDWVEFAFTDSAGDEPGSGESQ
jgi:hypothetical protein